MERAERTTGWVAELAGEAGLLVKRSLIAYDHA